MIAITSIIPRTRIIAIIALVTRKKIVTIKTIIKKIARATRTRRITITDNAYTNDNHDD